MKLFAISRPFNLETLEEREELEDLLESLAKNRYDVHAYLKYPLTTVDEFNESFTEMGLVVIAKRRPAEKKVKK